MNTKGHYGFVATVVIIAASSVAAVLAQRQKAALLRVERETVRMELGEVERLRAENLRLRGLQIPAEKLEQMRADHAALPRLRAELEAMQRR